MTRQKYTLVLPVDSHFRSVFLGKKLSGLGAGKVNGFGGKIQDKESAIDCAIRELDEELRILVVPDSLYTVATVEVISGITERATVTVFMLNCRQHELAGRASQEFKDAQWYGYNEVPYFQMHKTDKLWMPYVFEGYHVHAYLSFQPGAHQFHQLRYATITID